MTRAERNKARAMEEQARRSGQPIFINPYSGQATALTSKPADIQRAQDVSAQNQAAELAKFEQKRQTAIETGKQRNVSQERLQQLYNQGPQSNAGQLTERGRQLAEQVRLQRQETGRQTVRVGAQTSSLGGSVRDERVDTLLQQAATQRASGNDVQAQRLESQARGILVRSGQQSQARAQAFERPTATQRLGQPASQIPFRQSESGVTQSLVQTRQTPQVIGASPSFAGLASKQRELEVSTTKQPALRQEGGVLRPVPPVTFVTFKPQAETKPSVLPSRERPGQTSASLDQVLGVLRTGSRVQSKQFFKPVSDMFKMVPNEKPREDIVGKFERITDINRRQRELGGRLAFFLPKSLEPKGYAIASRLVASEESNLVPIFTALPRATRGKEAQVRNILGVLTKSPKLATSKETPVSDIGVGFGKFLGRPTEQAQLAAEGYAFGGTLRVLAKGVTLSPTLLRAAGSKTGQFLGKTAGLGLLGVAGYSEYADVQAQPTERLKRERIGQIPGRFASFGLGVEAERATLGGLTVRQTRFGEPFGEIQREASIQKFTKSPPQREFLRTLASAQRELRVKSPQPTPKPLEPETFPGDATLSEKRSFINVIREEEATVFGGLSRERTFGKKVKEPTDPDVAFRNKERALNKLDFDLNTPELRSKRFERVTGGIKEPETLGDIKDLSELNQFAFREKDIRLPTGERYTRQSEELGRLLESFITPGRLERRGEKDITAAKQLTQFLLEEQARTPVGKRRAKRLQDIRQRFEASKDVQFTFLEQPRKSLTKTIGEKLSPFRPQRNIFEELGIQRKAKSGATELDKQFGTIQKYRNVRQYINGKEYIDGKLSITSERKPLPIASREQRLNYFEELKQRGLKLEKPKTEFLGEPGSRIRAVKTKQPSFLPNFKREKSRLPFEKPKSKIVNLQQSSPFEPRRSQIPREPSPFPKPKPSEIPKTPSTFTPSSFRRTPSEFTPSGFTDRSFFNEPSGFRTPPDALFGLKGGEIASTREGRGLAPTSRYAPSLTAILRGIKITKVPKTSFSGFEVRGVPVKRLGGLAGNIGARLRREFRLPVNRKQGKRRSKSRR